MNDSLLKLINSLIIITEKAKIKWSEGSSENEYFLSLGEIGILLSKTTDNEIRYILRFLKPDGSVQFSISFSASDGDLYNRSEVLYNLIEAKSPEATRTIEELLGIINEKIGEQ